MQREEQNISTGDHSDLLRSLTAGVEQGLLTTEQRESLHDRLQAGEVAMVKEILLGIGVCEVPLGNAWSAGGSKDVLSSSNGVWLNDGVVGDVFPPDRKTEEMDVNAGTASVTLGEGSSLLGPREQQRTMLKTPEAEDLHLPKALPTEIMAEHVVAEPEAEDLTMMIVSDRSLPASDTAQQLQLLLTAAVNQGLLTHEQRDSLQVWISSGEFQIVDDILMGIGVCKDLNMSRERADAPWECMICFTEQSNGGWTCPDQHRFCAECMRHHVDAVPFPRCPQCSYALNEEDFNLLDVPISRIEAFTRATLCCAVDTLAGGGETLVRCSRAECANAVLLPSDRGRQCFRCADCSAPAFCTQCRQSPYHYHAGCDKVQSLRQQWVAWISGGREDYFGRARAAAESDERNRALHEAISRHNELEADEQWKAANCRLCPGCTRPISKIEGCDAMVCGRNYHGGGQQPGCGREFCFSSAAPYVAHVERRALPDRVNDNTSLRGRSVYHPFTDCCLCAGESRGISGLRFQCIHCDAFDICSGCEPQLADLHEQDHVFAIIFESDFRCPWLPKGTRVRIVRSGERLPRTHSKFSGGELEGQFGRITCRRRPPVEGYTVELELGQGSVEVELQFLEPVITSRLEAEKLLTYTLEHDCDPPEPAPVNLMLRCPGRGRDPWQATHVMQEQDDFADDSPLGSGTEGVPPDEVLARRQRAGFGGHHRRNVARRLAGQAFDDGQHFADDSPLGSEAEGNLAVGTPARRQGGRGGVGSGRGPGGVAGMVGTSALLPPGHRAFEGGYRGHRLGGKAQGRGVVPNSAAENHLVASKGSGRGHDTHSRPAANVDERLRLSLHRLNQAVQRVS